MRQGTFLPESTSSADAYVVRTTPGVESHSSTSVCAHVKNPNSGRHTKMLHALIGMGSAALAAAVAYPGN